VFCRACCLSGIPARSFAERSFSQKKAVRVVSARPPQGAAFKEAGARSPSATSRMRRGSSARFRRVNGVTSFFRLTSATTQLRATTTGAPAHLHPIEACEAFPTLFLALSVGAQHAQDGPRPRPLRDAEATFTSRATPRSLLYVRPTSWRTGAARYPPSLRGFCQRFLLADKAIPLAARETSVPAPPRACLAEGGSR